MSEELPQKDIRIDSTKFAEATLREFKRHKTYCILKPEDCHTYYMLEQILTDVLGKEVMLVMIKEYQ